jgi:hypothetical protein
MQFYGGFYMANKITTNKVDVGNGFVISYESSDIVPDTTTDAGPDTIKLHEDAQKPESDSNAEYDASEHIDVPEDVEKANESSFFGVILKRRSVEAFAKTKGVFPSAEAFFKSNECRHAITIAKQWAEKKKMSSASVNDLPENLKKLGFSAKSMSGVTIAHREAKGRLYVDILFKNGKGKVISKNFATVKIGSAEKKDKAGESKSAVDKVLLATENEDPIDNAFAATAEPAPVAEPAAEPAAVPEEPAAEPTAEPAAEPAAVPDVTPEEVDEEVSKGAESYVMAFSMALRSREEANAAVSTITDNEIDEVVGDAEGSDVEAVPVPSEEAPPAAPASSEEDEATKALESYLEALNL